LNSVQSKATSDEGNEPETSANDPQEPYITISPHNMFRYSTFNMVHSVKPYCNFKYGKKCYICQKRLLWYPTVYCQGKMELLYYKTNSDLKINVFLLRLRSYLPHKVYPNRWYQSYNTSKFLARRFLNNLKSQIFNLTVFASLSIEKHRMLVFALIPQFFSNYPLLVFTLIIHVLIKLLWYLYNVILRKEQSY